MQFRVIVAINVGSKVLLEVSLNSLEPYPTPQQALLFFYAEFDPRGPASLG